jgi:hypothetical protein
MPVHQEKRAMHVISEGIVFVTDDWKNLVPHIMLVSLLTDC